MFIYSLNDPITKQPRYIGATNNTYNRFYDHMKEKRVRKVSSWVKTLRENGLRPILEVIQETDEPKTLESFWIDYYRVVFGDALLNMLPGGGKPPIQDGSVWTGRKHSEETKAKLSMVNKGAIPPNRKFTKHEVEEIKSKRANGAKVFELAKEYGVVRQTITNVTLSKFYKEN